MILRQVLLSSRNLPKVTGQGPFRDSLQAMLAGECSSILKLTLPKFCSIKLQALQILAIQGEFTVSDENWEGSDKEGFMSIQATRPTAMYLTGDDINFHIENVTSDQSWKVLHRSLLAAMSEGLTHRVSAFSHELEGQGIVVFQSSANLKSIRLRSSEWMYVQRHQLVATTAANLGNTLSLLGEDKSVSWISHSAVNVKKAIHRLRNLLDHLGLIRHEVQKDLDKHPRLVAAKKSEPRKNLPMTNIVHGNLCVIRGPAKIVLRAIPL